MKPRLAVLAIFLFFPCVQAQDKPPARMAVYTDGGTSAGKEAVLKALGTFRDVKADRISAADIQNGKLKDYETLLVPGGSGSRESKALGPEGLEAIRRFVQDGGNYIGICAGAYLASSDYKWSLGILNAKVLDRQHWARGHGPVQIAFTDKGKAVFGAASSEATIVYWQGPLMAPGDRGDVPAFTPLARFETEITKNGAPPGVMKGSVAIAAGTFGKGRVLCFSPHPEKTEETYELLKSGLKWLQERAD